MPQGPACTSLVVDRIIAWNASRIGHNNEIGKEKKCL